MEATNFELCCANIISGPYSYEEIKDKPGVYRLQNYNISAAVVILSDGHAIYVNDKAICNFERMKDYNEHKFWLTNHVVPTEIV